MTLTDDDNPSSKKVVSDPADRESVAPQGQFATDHPSLHHRSERPPEIKAHHLARTAAVYPRQSCEEQVRTNTGSTEYQRGQARFPKDWGWQPDQIEIYDGDLGLSGTAAEHRPDYLRLCANIDKGLIGTVFASDMTRLGRNAAEWMRFLELCYRHQTLIVIDGKVCDIANPTERLIAQLLATLGEYDNVVRRQSVLRGRITKATQGHTVSAPPCGYVRLPDGSWIKDPDPRAQAAIAAVFRLFYRGRSCRQVLDALLQENITLPRRNKAGDRWVAPAIQSIYRILTHPAYKGDYTFRRRISDPAAGRDGRGRLRLRPAPPDMVIVTRNHHDPYIGEAEWDDIQRTLKLNNNSPQRRHLGPGHALCQGIVWCAMHRGWAMVTIYKRPGPDGSRRFSYFCQGDYHFGGSHCGYLAGELVDRAVIDRLFSRLNPPSLEVLRHAVRQEFAGQRSEAQRQKLELNRAQRDAVVLEERFLSLDSGSTEIAKSLEARLEGAKRDVKRLERLIETGATTSPTFDDAAFDELVELCRDLRALWAAPTTTNQDRKQLLRIMVRCVLVEARDQDTVQLQIQWTDGGAETVQAERTLHAYSERRIREMHAEGLTPEEIATNLNDSGLRNHNRLWLPETIAKKIRG